MIWMGIAILGVGKVELRWKSRDVAVSYALLIIVM